MCTFVWFLRITLTQLNLSNHFNFAINVSLVCVHLSDFYALFSLSLIFQIISTSPSMCHLIYFILKGLVPSTLVKWNTLIELAAGLCTDVPFIPSHYYMYAIHIAVNKRTSNMKEITLNVDIPVPQVATCTLCVSFFMIFKFSEVCVLLKISHLCSQFNYKFYCACCKK